MDAVALSVKPLSPQTAEDELGVVRVERREDGTPFVIVLRQGVFDDAEVFEIREDGCLCLLDGEDYKELAHVCRPRLLHALLGKALEIAEEAWPGSTIEG